MLCKDNKVVNASPRAAPAPRGPQMAHGHILFKQVPVKFHPDCFTFAGEKGSITIKNAHKAFWLPCQNGRQMTAFIHLKINSPQML